MRNTARPLVVHPSCHVSRPFHTACLAAVIPKDEKELDRQAKTTVQSVFDQEGENILRSIIKGNMSSDNEISSHASTGARRLMGMDEAYAGFFHILASEPKLVVGDFDERKLGLLRLSINLNPAMVARVTSWIRSKYN